MSPSPTALVIGGTGPTGPGVVHGLLDRGFAVTILHGGHHEVPLPDRVLHLHADPHFAATLREGLGDATFDLVVAQYGRLSVVSELMKGRTTRLIAIGGATGSLAAPGDRRWGPAGRPAVLTEDRELLEDDIERNKFGFRMAQAEQALFDAHHAGHYAATYLGYPIVYGPRVLIPHEWCIVRRILDGRRQLVCADGGIKIESRLFTRNAIAAVLKAVDLPERAAGEKFVVTDEDDFCMRQRIEFVARHMGVDIEIIDVPFPAATPCHPYWRNVRENRMRSSAKIRRLLDFEDETPVADALGETVDHLLEHRPAVGGDAETKLADRFDYAVEDGVIDHFLEASRQAAAADPGRPAHPYRHPKSPGEAWTPPGS